MKLETVAVAIVTMALLAPPSTTAATSCFNVSCASSCAPAAPVAITTLVLPEQFPAGADTPIAFIDPADGSRRRLIATKQGAILVWDGETATVRPTPFLDLRSATGGPVLFDPAERGLVSMAVDPDYAANGRFYVFYSRVGQGPDTFGDMVIERYQRSAANPNVADPAPTGTVLTIDHPAPSHNGGHVAFGPGGFLYVSTGDGGGGRCDNDLGADGDSQRADRINGKMLRIDVRGIDPGGGQPDDCGVGIGEYTVPTSNPFFGQEPACDEVWALGLRNPFRFTFDRLTGDLFISDVGHHKWEEINLKSVLTPAPVNFGWVCREGCETADNEESLCPVPGCPTDLGQSCQFPRSTGLGGLSHWDPVLCHYNGGWKSIMSGYRYRGGRVPSIFGDYLYGDNQCGQIWKTTTFDPDVPAAIDAACWASGFAGTYGFAEDHLAELYVVLGGAHRIDCVHNGQGCFWAAFGGLYEDGFESGLSTLWSEGSP